METQLHVKWKKKSSLALKGRFFLLVLFFSGFQFLFGINNDPPAENNTEKLSTEKVSQGNPVKIYVTGGAEISISENAITSPIIIIKNHQKAAKIKKAKKIRKAEKIQKKTIQKKSSKPKANFSENQNNSQFSSFNESLGKGIITSHHSLVSAIFRLFYVPVILFWTVYLIFYDNENCFFRRILGRYFQRPPPL